MRLEKLGGFNIASNPFQVALSTLWILIFIYMIFVHFFLGFPLAWSTVIDLSSPEEKHVMKTMFDRSPTFSDPAIATLRPRGIFVRRNAVTSPIIVCKQHSQVFRPQGKPFDLFLNKKSIINSS